VYHHMNQNMQIKTGKCHSVPTVQENGKIKLYEQWQWTSGDYSKGEFLLVEVPDAEIWDLYNENRELLGKDHIRGEQLPIDGYHLVVHVWIRNSKGQYLIS
jgi:hypothetical protein